MDSSSSRSDDIFASYGRHLSQKHFRKVLGDNRTNDYPLPPSLRCKDSNARPGTVGIIGAGAGGLYTAMILESLGIDYQIIEAQTHVGGRLFTYKFQQDPAGDGFNYYDVGAMRFPMIPAMTRLQDLFNNRIKIQTQKYIFQCDQQIYSYNDRTYTLSSLSQATGDPFDAAAVIQDVSNQIDKNKYIVFGSQNIMKDAMAPFISELSKENGNPDSNGWSFMDKFESYSTRAYLSLYYKPSPNLGLPNTHLSNDIVNWCETFDKSTGWYDRALTENVLEAIAFNEPNSATTNFLCVDGGAQQIANAMLNSLTNGQQNITYNTPVSAISISPDQSSVTLTGVNGRGGQYTNTFQNVISTIPLPVLRTIDLRSAGLTPMQSNALRELNYGPAVKVGMQFRSAWWRTAVNTQGTQLNIQGGQSYTDSMLRTVVYPSFGDIQGDNTLTLIATYCWTEDAARFGALINANKDAFLQDLVLRELETLHQLPDGYLTNEILEMHAWSWAHDPYTMGAYAFFGPGKFQDVYTSLTSTNNMSNEGGRLIFAGEAISTRHAWVEGALDSAWRAVAELLVPYPGLWTKFTDKWGLNPEWVPEGSTNDNAALFDPKRSILIQHLSATHWHGLNQKEGMIGKE